MKWSECLVVGVGKYCSVSSISMRDDAPWSPQWLLCSQTWIILLAYHEINHTAKPLVLEECVVSN